MHDFVEGTWATISGIAFTLITVRIGLGWSTPTSNTTNVTMSKPPRFAARSPISTTTTGTQSISMHQVIDVSGDGDESPTSGMKRGILTHNSDVTAVV